MANKRGVQQNRTPSYETCLHRETLQKIEELVKLVDLFIRGQYVDIEMKNIAVTTVNVQL